MTYSTAYNQLIFKAIFNLIDDLRCNQGSGIAACWHFRIKTSPTNRKGRQEIIPTFIEHIFVDHITYIPIPIYQRFGANPTIGLSRTGGLRLYANDGELFDL